MKKLTAGIFTVLMGLVSVNAADAAVASKGYVDNKFFTIDAQTQHVAAQKTTDDAQDAKINKNTADIATNAGAIATNAEKIGDATFTDDTLKYIKGEANLTAAVKKLDAAVTVASGDLSNVYTKTEADNKFIDTTEIEGYATDGDLNAVSGVANAADTLSKTNQGAINVLNGDVSTDGSVAKKINDATATITNAYTTADTATLNSANAYTDQQIEALDLQAISRVPAACGNAGNYCVLTTNGTKFVWEVIVREDTTLGEGDTGLYGNYPATEAE